MVLVYYAFANCYIIGNIASFLLIDRSMTHIADWVNSPFVIARLYPYWSGSISFQNFLSLFFFLCSCFWWGFWSWTGWKLWCKGWNISTIKKPRSWVNWCKLLPLLRVFEPCIELHMVMILSTWFKAKLKWCCFWNFPQKASYH